MKYLKHLFEGVETFSRYETIKKILDIDEFNSEDVEQHKIISEQIKQNCGSEIFDFMIHNYIHLPDKSRLYRGSKHYKKIAFAEGESPTNRESLTMNNIVNSRIDDIIKNVGAKALRRNSIFTSPSKRIATGYFGYEGGTNVIIPWKDTSFSFFKTDDLFVTLSSNVRYFFTKDTPISDQKVIFPFLEKIKSILISVNTDTMFLEQDLPHLIFFNSKEDNEDKGLTTLWTMLLRIPKGVELLKSEDIKSKYELLSRMREIDQERFFKMTGDVTFGIGGTDIIKYMDEIYEHLSEVYIHGKYYIIDVNTLNKVFTSYLVGKK